MHHRIDLMVLVLYPTRASQGSGQKQAVYTKGNSISHIWSRISTQERTYNQVCSSAAFLPLQSLSKKELQKETRDANGYK